MSDTGSWRSALELANGELVLRKRSGAVEITFNRPAKHNAFTDRMYDGILHICEVLADDQAIRAVVFRGSGGMAFAAGNDISKFATFHSGSDGVQYEAKIRAMLNAIESLPQVTIAAVQGVCVGGGLAVANACDLRVASATAQFGYPIARTLGNALSAPVVLRCAQVFGDALTREMLLASRLIDASRAHMAGAVMQVVAQEELEREVNRLVDGIRLAAPHTIRITKDQLRLNVPGYDSVLDDERLSLAYGSSDFREGVDAFLAKRSPNFGR